MKHLSVFLRQKIIDSRDIIERIEELKVEGGFLKEGMGESFLARDLSQVSHLKFMKKDIENEIALLSDFRSECEGYSTEFTYGESIISWHYFEEYCQDLASDCGYLPRLEGATFNPIYDCIDWKRWAENLKYDYSEVSCDGNNYFIRNN